MGVWLRKYKRKDGTVSRTWYGFFYADTGQRDDTGRKVYKRHTAAIADFPDMPKKKDAEDEFARIKARIIDEDTPLSENPTLMQAAAEYMKHNRDKRSWKRDEVALNHYMNYAGPYTRLSDTNALTIDRFKTHRTAKVSKSTLKRELEVIRRFYTLARKWNKYKKPNPVTVAGIDRVKRKPRRILTETEQAAIFASAPTPYLRIWLTLRLTGMRPGEAVRLRKDCIDFDKGIIHLTPEDTKEGKAKVIIITEALRGILMESLEDNGTPYVFLNTKGKPFTGGPQGVMRALRKLAHRLGLDPGVTQHSLRHTYATDQLAAGVDIDTLRAILGHADIRTTQIYLHTQQERLRNAAEIAEKRVSKVIVSTKLSTKNKGHKKTG